ncbi:MAG: pectate lyase-like adhesive domain-containing protein [Acidimicrobiia bacterium]
MKRRTLTGRVVRLLAITALCATPVVLVTTAGVAGAAEVSDQDSLRDAFEDGTVTEITLTGDITIDSSGDEGCDQMTRNTSNSLLIDGQGFSIVKDEADCDDDGQEGERIFRQRGDGTITFENVTVSGGTKIGGPGGALKSDGPVVVNNSTFSGNQALWCDYDLSGADVNGESYCDNPYGGAIYAEGSVTVTTSAFTGNHADDSGGGIFTWSNIVVNGSSFAGNSAGTGYECWCSGGGFLAYSGADITGSAVTGNSAGCTQYCGAEGGGFYSGGPVSLFSSTVSGNETGCEDSCDGNGGGFFGSGFGEKGFAAAAAADAGVAAADPGQILVDNSTLNGNTASCTINYTIGDTNAQDEYFCGSGGGFFADEGELVSVNQSTLSNNTATCEYILGDIESAEYVLTCGAGGGFYAYYVDGIAVNASTFNGNSALSYGGAFSTGGGCECTIDVVNSTVTANTTGGSGAIDVSSKYEVLNLVHDTIVGNIRTEMADIPAPAAVVPPIEANVTASTLGSFGTIIAQPVGGVNCLVWDETVSDGYNFSDDESCGFDDPTDIVTTPNNPQLLALGAYGGPTNTMRPEGEIEGTTLVSLSPVVDKIPAAACVLDVDQRGVSRPQTVIANACDIGAVEITAAEITISPEVVTIVTPKFTG